MKGFTKHMSWCAGDDTLISWSWICLSRQHSGDVVGRYCHEAPELSRSTMLLNIARAAKFRRRSTMLLNIARAAKFRHCDDWSDLIPTSGARYRAPIIVFSSVEVTR